VKTHHDTASAFVRRWGVFLTLTLALGLALAFARPALADSPSAGSRPYFPLLMWNWIAPASFWSAEQAISPTTSAQQYAPAIAADAAGNAYVVWADNRNERRMDIYFAYRPAGAAWGAPVRVNDDAAGFMQSTPDIAVDAAGNAWAVWTDNRNGLNDLAIYAAYRPRGGVWGPNERVSDVVTKSVAYYPAVEMDGAGVPYVVWQDYRGGTKVDVYFSRRAPGVGWTKDEIVNDVAGAAGPWDFTESSWPALAVDAVGNAHALWRDFRNSSSEPDIYAAYRPAGGAWQANSKVNIGLPRYWQAYPSVAVGPDGCAHAVWRFNPKRIFSSDRCPGGDWQPAVEVTNDAGGNADAPSIVVTPANTQHVVWQDDRGNGYLKLYWDWRRPGGVWHADAPVTTPEMMSRMQVTPDLAVDGRGCVYAVWEDRRPDDLHQIHFAHSCRP